MFKFIKDLFDEDKKTLDKYREVVAEINALEPEIKDLSDTQLAAQTKKFKSHLEKGLAEGKSETDLLNEILPEAFATVRETSRRVLGMRHFDVQLLAGIALHHGSVTEQKTGEGKTLTVTAPLYLNALLGKGAHLVTVNDYLAELGCGWMGRIYDFLGLTTAVIIHDHSRKYNPEIDSTDRGDERLEHFEEISRKEAYLCDITYGTNNEFGFDYLRDNMVQTLDRMVQREENAHQYAIVDEADSILIDEARTPLIISAPDSEPTRKYTEYAKMITSLTREVDYTVDEKARSVSLTDLGVKRIEQKIGVSNLYEESFDTIHHIESALKAKALFERDKNYIVREGQVVIVDEHTGRLMYGRRYSEGLHQAIEAKEGVKIQQESRTLATISIQNYFRLYSKLSGMTGTAVTEAEEFGKIYNLGVLEIPTNLPVIRDDKPDVVYKTTAAKYSAIVKEVARINEIGQPVMIGTKSIEHNQIISNFLKRKKIKHQVLNAKNHEKEAFIIADAGKKGAITVATNIAGRGVDIVLGGAKPELKDYRKAQTTTKKALKADWKKVEELGLSIPPSINPKNYKLKQYAKALDEWQTAHDAVVNLGGLYILGTERHESRRIDNQLRGRAGRQGDPGASQFFVSLEDEIMRIFGGEQISKVMDMLKIEENQPIEHAMVSKSIESAQVKVEGFFFDQRKRLVEFDDVMNKQRDIIYQRRRRLLSQAESDKAENRDMDPDTPGIQTLHDQMLQYIKDEISAIVHRFAPEGFTESEYRSLIKEFSKMIPFDQKSQDQLVKNIQEDTETQEIITKLEKVALDTYAAKEKAIGSESMRDLERLVTLSTIDEKWMEHLDAMDSLKQGIWMRGDKRTVLSEYKKESFAMFEELITSIEATIANRIYRVQFTNRKPVAPKIDLSKAQEQKQAVSNSLSQSVSQVAPAPAAPNASAKAVPTSTQGSTSDLAAVLGSAKAKQRVNKATAKVKIGRNDPCPCGSGKKYKKCGLINAPEHKG